MSEIKIVNLPALVTQNTTDLSETSANGGGSYKESRAQQLSYWAQTFVQTTGSSTSGHFSLYGSNGQTIKDSGVVGDTHQNVYANNLIGAYTTTATAGSTTTLTVASAYNQYFTGSTTQTVQLPVTSTLSQGFSFYIVNNSTGAVTVESSGANTIQVMAPNTTVLVTCILITGTSAASWASDYNSQNTVGEKWTVVSGTSQTMSSNNGYFANNSSLVNLLLPPTSNVGDVIQVAGMGTGGWQINEGVGQFIQVGKIQSAVALGYIASTNQYDSIKLVCNVANSSWTTVSAPQGNITVFDAPGLILWFDANDPYGNGSQPSTGTSLNPWVDKSGISGNATGSYFYQQPIFTTGVQNSLPGIYFTPAVYENFLTVSSVTCGSNLTLFVVSQSANNTLFIEQSNDAGSNNGFYIYGKGTAPATIRNGGTSATLANTSNWLGTSTNLAMIQYNGSAINGYENSSLALTASASITNSPVTDLLHIGARATSGNDMTGYIFEVLLFNAVLTSNQIAAVNGYLNTKWAIY